MTHVQSVATSVPVLEIFSTVQGEGPTVGTRQIFVRLAGCDLRCLFCDTPESYPTPKHATVKSLTYDRSTVRSNPVAIEDVIQIVAALQRDAACHRAVSITGGEPLLRPAAVTAIAKGVRALGLDVHLETGGHRPEALRAVLPYVDAVSPDVKLESACGVPTPWREHEESYQFLARAPGKAVAVKAVVVSTTSVEEIRQAARLVASHLPDTPFVLQPVTQLSPDRPSEPTGAHMLDLQAAALEHHGDVRVIPQLHRVLDLP